MQATISVCRVCPRPYETKQEIALLCSQPSPHFPLPAHALPDPSSFALRSVGGRLASIAVDAVQMFATQLTNRAVCALQKHVKFAHLSRLAWQHSLRRLHAGKVRSQQPVALGQAEAYPNSALWLNIRRLAARRCMQRNRTKQHVRIKLL